jgi:hypothetical protein
MNDFEDTMRSAMRRDPAPADFAARVLAKTTALDGAARRPKVLTMPIWRRPAAWAMAAGLTIAAVVPPSVMEYQRRREARALEAKRELLLALEVTRLKLKQTRERIQRNSRHTL